MASEPIEVAAPLYGVCVEAVFVADPLWGEERWDSPGAYLCVFSDHGAIGEFEARYHQIVKAEALIGMPAYRIQDKLREADNEESEARMRARHCQHRHADGTPIPWHLYG